jgi:hypothetical protein
MLVNQLFVFIPYIKPTMNKNDVIQIFDTLEIGKIVYIDLHNKTNECNQMYQFAFVKFEPYNTLEGNRVSANTTLNMPTRVAYDNANPYVYLEIKPYLSIEQRTTVQSLCRELLEVLPRPSHNRIHTAFETLNEEYDEIQKEINELMAAPVYSIWTTPLLFVQ